MQKIKSQAGSAHSVIVIILVVALLGVLGFVFWNNFLRKEPAPSQDGSEPTSVVQEACADGEDASATNGIFCSKEMGIKFSVPNTFKNKLTKTDNYQVYQGSLNPNSKTSAGLSERVYQAVLSGNDNFTFTIAQEPLRTGYVDVAHNLQGTYYDQSTGELTLVTTTSGNYSKGEVVPSFTVGGVRVFKAQVGDAGMAKNTYFAVIKDKIIKITLVNEGYIGHPDYNPTTIDASKVFDELNMAIKSLQVI